MTQKIIDNKINLLGDDLRVELKSGSKVRIAASCFTLFAFNELKKELSEIEELNVIFTQPTYTKNDYIVDAGRKESREFYIPKQKRETSLFGTDLEIRLRNKMTLKAIARECADWVREKVLFVSNKTDGGMQNVIAVEQKNGEKSVYINAPSEFSASGLGYEKSNDMNMGIFKISHNAEAQFYMQQFDEIFNDKKRVEDVTDEVVESISTAYKENSPEFIYFVILYNIFSEFLDDLSEDNMPNEATGFKNTKLWSMLYDFQKDGVISIINKLEKHNGCILADSVGLGKTFTALAVILYYSLRNKSVLVLCPKRLSENWTQYSGDSNDTTNIFYEDRIRYEVLYHTDLGRDGRAHNGRDLKRVNWGNYDLVVIDESHNFRNNNPAKNRVTRYEFLVENVIKAGVKTKVLMLSATPVNTRYNDLKNQLALAYSQNPDAFEDSLDTRGNVDTIFKNAQTVFNEWSNKPASARTNKELIDNLSIDFKILLDSVTIARSRKNIVKYYNSKSIGTFPERLKPQSLSPELTNRKDILDYSKIHQLIMKMTLSVYDLFGFVQDSKKIKYEKEDNKGFKNLTLSGRNRGLKRLMTVNLLKRLESSVEAFRLTLTHVLNLNKEELEKLNLYESGQLVPKKASSKKRYNYDELGFENEEDFIDFIDKDQDIEIDYADVDRISWRKALNDDILILEKLLENLNKITPEYDKKLSTLKEIIDAKIKKPINKNNKKLVIFSAFANTANYLYENISKWAKAKYGIESALVEGKGNKTTIKNCSKHTNDILTMFSPISKNREAAFASIKRESSLYSGRKSSFSKSPESYFKDIDILIATDCISEGQNLQDCDICINYDIHWNPVRIVQRFGRIDRLGSKNEVVGLINFWPPLPLNQYINLIDRVKNRMVIVDQTATADDNILNPDDQMDDYREIQIKRLREGENIDLEDTNTGVSISDLGLNEFRMDAVDMLKIYGEPNRVPKGLHAVVAKELDKEILPGIILILKNHNKDINIKNQNLLHPYYLLYLDEKGNVINTHLEPKEILNLLRLACSGKSHPIQKACDAFNKETNDGLNMQKYNELLSDAVSTIIEVKKQSDILSILGGDIDAARGVKIKGLDDFELIAFVVVK